LRLGYSVDGLAGNNTHIPQNAKSQFIAKALWQALMKMNLALPVPTTDCWNMPTWVIQCLKRVRGPSEIFSPGFPA
jgi:hypothetical protein